MPPSRAYLKLWEILTLIGKWPKAGERCLEIGASPGSWTWALAELGAEVVAVDRAPLDPSIACLPHITFLKKDAFTLQPDANVQWLFSDLICYPHKLLEWIHPWLELKINIVCTLKFQGEKDYQILTEFEKIEGSDIFRLFHNKHELTFVRLQK